MWRKFSYRCGDFHIYSTAEVKLKFYNLLSSRNPEGTDSCSRWLRACVFLGRLSKESPCLAASLGMLSFPCQLPQYVWVPVQEGERLPSVLISPSA